MSVDEIQRENGRFLSQPHLAAKPVFRVPNPNLDSVLGKQGQMNGIPVMPVLFLRVMWESLNLISTDHLSFE